MRLLHCADLHLDAALTNHISIEHAKELQSELLLGFGRIVQDARDLGAEAVLISGDLFDSERVLHQSARYIYDTIRQASDISFFYLCGNHDPIGGPRLDRIPENLRIFSGGWESESCALSGGRQVVISARTTGRRPDQIPEKPHLRKEDVNIVMLHGQLTRGSTTEYGIDLRMLEEEPIAYLALGHLHSHQVGALRYGTYCYPGCHMGRGFDECGEHGYELIEIDEATGEVTHLFRPLEARLFWELPVDLTDASGLLEVQRRCEEVLSEQGVRSKDYVKLILKGQVAETVDLMQLRFLLKGLCEELRLRDESGMKTDWETLLAQPSLKGELARCLRDSDLSEDKQHKILALGLKVLRGEGAD